jgi:hypothetical protein
MMSDNVLIDDKGNLYFIDADISSRSRVESAATVRFHAEAETEADRVEEWFNELEKGHKGESPRFQTGTPNAPKPRLQDKDQVHLEQVYRPLMDNELFKKGAQGLSWFREKFQDRAILVRRLEEEIQRRGGTIAKEDSIYEQIDQITSRVHGKVQKMSREYYKPLFDDIAEITKIEYTDAQGIKQKIDYHDVGRYLIALHAPERNAYLKVTKKVDDGSGVTDIDAAQMVTEFESKVPKALIDKLKKHVAKIREFNLQNLYHYGRISKDEYDDLKTRYNYYVPLKGWEENEDNDLQEYIASIGSGVAGAHNLMREAKGRASMADNPVDFMLYDSCNIIAWGEKNRIKQAAYNLVIANKQHNDMFVGQHIPKRKLEKWKAKQHEVEAWIDGEKFVVTFGQSKIGSIINGTRDDSPWSSSWWHRSWWGRLTRFRSAINTAKNPAFIFKNMNRDMQQIVQRILITDGSRMAVRVIKNMPTAFGSLWNEIWSDSKKHSKQRIKGKDIYGASKIWSVADLYNEFMTSGAVTGFMQTRRMADVKKNIAKMLQLAKGERGIHKQIYDVANGFLNNLAEISENSTRFAVYITYRSEGKTIAEAARAAKEASVNFNRQGEATAALGATWAYFNASMQASENTLHLAKTHPIAFGAISLFHIIKGFVMYNIGQSMLQWMASGADDDDEKRKILDMIKDFTDYRKYTNTFFPTAGGMIQMPMSHMFRPAHALGVMVGQLQDRTLKPSEFMDNMTSMMSQSLTPFEFNFGKDNMLRSFIPTNLQDIFEAWVFDTNFMGMPLSEQQFTIEQKENTKELHKAKSNTHPFFIKIAQVAARLGGFDPDNESKHELKKDGSLKTISSWFDFNPTHIEHIVRGITGGLGKFGLDIIYTAAGVVDAIANGDEAEPFDWNQVPISSSYYNQPPGGSYDTRRFWQMKRYIDLWYKEMKANYDNGKEVKGKRVEQLEDLYYELQNVYSEKIKYPNDIIKDNKTRINDAKNTIKTKSTLTVSRKLKLENEIDAWEKEIEELKKTRLRGYHEAVDLLEPKFRNIDVPYHKYK